MSRLITNNPGIGGLDEITDAEALFLQNLVGLSYTAGDILYHNGSDLINLGIGTATQVLQTNAGATAPEWAAVAGTTDEKVGVDSDATPDYLGVASNDGVLRTSSPITYTDGGDFITLAITKADTTNSGYLDTVDWDTFNDKQSALTFGIADTNKVQINSVTVADDDYAKFTATGLEGRNYAEVLSDIGAQASDASLTSIAGLTYVSGSFIALTAEDTYSVRTYAQTLSDIGAAATDQTMYIGTTAVAINRGTAALTLAGITLTTPDIGTPSAGNLSNCTAYEGTAVLSTGEGGGTKFLREDGDGTSSWQTIAGGGDVTKVGTPVDNQVGVWTGDGTIEGTAGLTYDGSNLLLTGDIGITGTRITKGWFTDLEVTNAIAGSVTGTAAIATTVTVTDNESTAEENVITFVAGAAGSGNVGLEADGDLTYNPSTGKITATGFIGALTGQADTVATITGLAPDTATTQATQASITTCANLVTVGALNAGSITSGFTSIDVGAGAITTTGTGALGNITLGTDGTISALTLTEKASIALDPAGGTDGDYSGITIAGIGGATIAFGKVVYLKTVDSDWYEADASTVTTAGDLLIGICVLATTDGNPITVLMQGQIRADTAFPALTIGAQVFLSETTGLITHTQPTTTDAVVQSMGFALTANEIYFSPSPDFITHV